MTVKGDGFNAFPLLILCKWRYAPARGKEMAVVADANKPTALLCLMATRQEPGLASGKFCLHYWF